MIRLAFSFVVVVNVIVALWLSGAGRGQNSQNFSANRPLIQGDTLILIAEVNPSQLTPSFVEEAGTLPVEELASPVEVVKANTSAQCVVLSSFKSGADAEVLADRIRDFGVNVDLKAEKTESPGPFMVYIKPFISDREARREMRVLKSSKVDSFIIVDGELTNGISLGVFGTEQNALAQKFRVAALGYEVETRHLTVQKEHFSLVASGEVLAALEDDYWVKIASENKDISIEQKVCNEVASGVKFQ